MRKEAIIVLMLLTGSCISPDTDPHCESDSKFTNYFFKNISIMLSYGAGEGISSDSAYKSLVNLETLTNTTTLDEISASFYDQHMDYKDINRSLTNWLIWYDANKCYTFSMAIDRFKEVARKNPLPDYTDTTIVKSLRIKYATLLLEGAPNSINDSIVISRDRNGRLSRLPSWGLISEE